MLSVLLAELGRIYGREQGFGGEACRKETSGNVWVYVVE